MKYISVRKLSFASSKSGTVDWSVLFTPLIVHTTFYGWPSRKANSAKILWLIWDDRCYHCHSDSSEKQYFCLMPLLPMGYLGYVFNVKCLFYHCKCLCLQILLWLWVKINITAHGITSNCVLNFTTSFSVCSNFPVTFWAILKVY